jgi:hypothetical protein
VQAATKYAAVAHQVAITLLDHVADMDADPKLDPALGREAGVVVYHTVLHLRGTANGIDDAAEFDEDTIACPLNDAPVMQSDGRVDQTATSGRSRANLRSSSAAASLLHPAELPREIAASFLASDHECPCGRASLPRNNLRGGRGANLTARFRRVPESPDLDWLRACVDFLVRRDA